MHDNLFFCFGPPKSGTTFLQRTLNLHPDISCPPEHQFDVLINGLTELLKRYDITLTTVDKRTGGQGTSPMAPVIQPQLFRYTVERMIWHSASGKKIAGANDNSIINKIDSYNTLFDSPKFIVIFRNPIDSAISAWHHNIRLAKVENNPAHERLMTQHGGLEDWIKHTATVFSRHAQAYKAFSQQHDNILMLRYEDLKNDKENSLTRLFDFLDADTNKEIISGIVEQSSIDAMRKISVDKDFFRSGVTDMGKDSISDEFRKQVAKISSEALKSLGYDM